MKTHTVNAVARLHSFGDLVVGPVTGRHSGRLRLQAASVTALELLPRRGVDSRSVEHETRAIPLTVYREDE